MKKTYFFLIKHLFVYLLLLLILFSAEKTLAQAGSLDASFGVGGKVTTDFATNLDRARAILVQSNRKIILVGGSDSPPAYDFAIARYNVNGTLDSSFGINGKVRTLLSINKDDEAYSAALQDDGKIIAAGYALTEDAAHFLFAMARYNTNGTLDSSFGNSGKVLTGFNGFDALGHSVAILANGKIILAGNRFNSGEIVLVRYTDRGKIDSTFGINGVSRAALGVGLYDLYAMTIQSNGRILIGGADYGGTGYDFGIRRFNANGSIDSTFGSNGIASTDFSGGSDNCLALAVQNDGKIVAGGRTQVAFGSEYNFGLARFNTNGSLDSGFGNHGKVITKMSDENDEANSVAIQADNKILLAGLTVSISNYTNFGLVRYNLDGSPDTAFGNKGIVTTDFSGSGCIAYALALQQDKKILLAGSGSGGGSGDFAVARYISDNPTISVKNIQIAEGNSGTSSAKFILSLDQPSNAVIKIDYKTFNGSADHSDYYQKSGTVTFLAQQVSKNILVNIKGDTVKESNEKFYLKLSNPINAQLSAKDSATCTILNDDTGFDLLTNNYLQQKTQIKISPNPVLNNLNILIKISGKAAIYISDANGRIVKTQNQFIQNGIIHGINVSLLPPGNYFITISMLGKTFKEKFIKH